MNLAIDTSGWLARYLQSDAHEVTINAMNDHERWFASELVMAEAITAIERLGLDRSTRSSLEDAMRSDWDRVFRVPVDDGCIVRATEIARAHPAKMIDALHLAAATRLPGPVKFLTHEAAQMPIAIALGFDVVGVSDTPTQHLAPRD